MCGIAGLLSVASITGHTDPALEHRGPDAHGSAHRRFPGGEAFLHHDRLAIQDLTDAGAQPFASADGRYLLVYNGEIYNYPALRADCEARGDAFRSDMDGEVILKLWARLGESALDRLNGIYAICLLDLQTGDAVLARDPLGVKPLFMTSSADGALHFASELAALRRIGAPVGGPDVAGLAQFLTFLWIPQPNTPYMNARSLRPGETVRWRGGATESSRIRYRREEIRDVEPTLIEEVGTRVRRAAQRQLLADVPVGLMASGGVDSSLLWWAATAGLDQAYTIAWPATTTEGLGEDTDAVRQLERRFETPTTYLPGDQTEPVVLPASGDLFADPAYELTREVARAAQADGIKVLLGGQGGDEIFAGYRRHQVVATLQRVHLGAGGRVVERLLGLLAGNSISTRTEYAARLGRALAEGDAFRAYMQLCSYSTAVERAQALGCTEAEVSDEVVWAQHRDAYETEVAAASFLRRVLKVDREVYLPGLGLAYTDRAGMEFGVEIRVPWLDLELVEWANQLPDRALIRRQQGKWLPKALADQELGRALAHRPKRGFAAPAALVQRGHHQRGERGHRQGRYFARARQVLDAHLSTL